MNMSYKEIGCVTILLLLSCLLYFHLSSLNIYLSINSKQYICAVHRQFFSSCINSFSNYIQIRHLFTISLFADVPERCSSRNLLDFGRILI